MWAHPIVSFVFRTFRALVRLLDRLEDLAAVLVAGLVAVYAVWGLVLAVIDGVQSKDAARLVTASLLLATLTYAVVRSVRIRRPTWLLLVFALAAALLAFPILYP